MPKTELAINSYPKLFSRIKSVFIEGLQKIEAEKVKAYWMTGKLISNYYLGSHAGAPLQYRCKIVF